MATRKKTEPKPVDLEEQFYQIAQKAIADAEAIECSLARYRDGLLTMHQALKERIEQIEDELKEDEITEEDE